MPILSTLILTDRTPTTPVNHTFNPRERIGSGGLRLVRAGVSAIADSVISIEPRQTPGGRRKVTVALSIPVVQTRIENGVTTYVPSRASRGKVEFDFAPDSTEQERKDLVGMLSNALAEARVLVNDTLVKNEAIL